VLRLADRWIWDFWHVTDGDTVHLFFLQADRALGDPDLRHWHASIGHAVSHDLRNWVMLPDALRPAPVPAWDDYTVWTGNVVRGRRHWHLLYTGTSHADGGLVQRVGHAVSNDLITWERVDDGLAFELDARWYETLDTAIWHDQAWRDPVVLLVDDEWNALVTARLPAGDTNTRGTIGRATSADLATWVVCPPLTGPTPFGHLEIPDVCSLADRWYLLFSSAPGAHGSAELHAGSDAGTYAVPSTDGPLGPWDWDSMHMILGDGWYGAKLITPPGRPAGSSQPVVALAWRDRDDERFAGWIGDPMAVDITDGTITVSPDHGSAQHP
jgi:beta-fructofuranosidase